jgi:NAD(P)H-dependent FMN reductase
MIEIIAGTDRPGSRTLVVARLISSIFDKLKVQAQILDLAQIPLQHMHGAGYDQTKMKDLRHSVDRVNGADGLIMVIPEYNGSFPGALKHFIDYWKFPQTFEGRPVAFVGLGGRFGGLRAVEQMQQIFGYRNAYLFPQRVFLTNINNLLKDGQLTDSTLVDLLQIQAGDFAKFIRALKSEKLDANSKVP